MQGGQDHRVFVSFRTRPHGSRAVPARFAFLFCLLLLQPHPAGAAQTGSSVGSAPAPSETGALDLHTSVPKIICDTGASGYGEIVEDPAEGLSFRVNFELPASANSVHIELPIAGAFTLPSSPWGIELWAKMDGPHPVYLTLMVRETDGQLWRYGLPIRTENKASEWQRLLVEFDWLQLITWERTDGRFDANRLKTLSLRIENSNTNSPQKGSLWLRSFKIVSAVKKTVPTVQDAFTTLDLTAAYDSDGVAFREDPLDGDFHTGEWEHRALPAESFPRDRQAVYLGIPFRMPDVADGLDNHIRCNGQELTGWAERGYSALYFLATGKFGPQMGDVTLVYADGSTSKVLLEISDWTGGPTANDEVALLFPLTYHNKGIEARQPKLYIQSVRVDPSRPLRAIQLPYSDFLKVFALTLSSAETPPKVGVLQDKSRDTVYPHYAMKPLAELTFDAPARSVGVFGGYLARNGRSYRLSEPLSNGGCVFALDATGLAKEPIGSAIFWEHFNPDGSPYRLGTMRAPGVASGLVRSELLGWTCIRYTRDIERNNGIVPFHVYLSRAFPAALYQTDLADLSWEDPTENGPGMVSFVSGSTCATQPLDPGRTLPALDAPWILLWHAGGGSREFDIPLLIVLERRPAAITIGRSLLGSIEIRLNHPDGAGCVAVMPLFGIRQVPYAETKAWAEKGLPEDVVERCRRWTARIGAFPLGIDEAGSVDEAAGTVTIRNEAKCHEMKSEWGIAPEHVILLPPVLALARSNGYAVSTVPELLDAKCDTFYGPMLLAPDRSLSYTIPLPHGVTHMLAPANVKNSETAATILQELASLISEELPKDPSKPPTSDVCGGLSIVRAFAPVHLQIGADPRRDAYCATVARSALLDQNLKVEKEPLSGQFYLMDDTFWAKDAAYDKEWAIGYILQGFWNYAHYDDDSAFLRDNWDRIRGLYRYYQIIFDWATCSTFTMVEGFGANSDGSRIAAEGILAMARMARMTGDETIWTDACLRSAKQMLSLYATWFAPQWAADHNYVTARNRRVPPENAELRFAPDASWWETHTCNVSIPIEFFQATHALYLYNLSNLLFLHDTGLDESRLRSWLCETMPALHPAWFDGNEKCAAEGGRYYGSEYTMAHLVSRALLFHEDMKTLYDYYLRSSRNTRVTKEWYSPRGTAPFALSAMVTGAAPLVIAPVNTYRVVENVYDAAALTTLVTLQPLGAQADTLWIRCWKQPVLSVQVGGAPVGISYDAKTDFLTIPIPAQSGSAVNVTVCYGPSPTQ